MSHPRTPIADIRRDPTLQLREGGLDMERVEDMAEAMSDGAVLPPVTTVGPDKLLADGFHRVHAVERIGGLDIATQHVDGDYNTALAIALRANTSGSKQLTRTERHAAIKRLLAAGWTAERIAKETGVHNTTIRNIANALAIRGELPKSRASTRPAGGREPKAVAVLATDSPAQALDDTTLVRIAERVPVEHQVAFAEAVAEAKLSEPRTREAIRTMKERGVSPREAVALHTPTFHPIPLLPSDAAVFLERRIKAFFNETMRYKDRDLTVGSIIELLATDAYGSRSAESLASTLAKYSVLLDHAATVLRTGSPSNGRAIGEGKVKVVG